MIHKNELDTIPDSDVHSIVGDSPAQESIPSENEPSESSPGSTPESVSESINQAENQLPESLPEPPAASVSDQVRQLVENLVYSALDPEGQKDQNSPTNGVHEVNQPSLDSNQAPSDNEFDVAHTAFSLAYTDCFLIFRALCKLSTKELPPT